MPNFSGLVKVLSSLVSGTPASDDCFIFGRTDLKKVTLSGLKNALGIDSINTALEGKQDAITKVRFYNIKDDTGTGDTLTSTAEWHFKNTFEDNSAFIAYIVFTKAMTYRIDGLKVDVAYGYMQISSYGLSEPYYGTAMGGSWTWR